MRTTFAAILVGIVYSTLLFAGVSKKSLTEPPALPDNSGVNIHFYDNAIGMNTINSLGVKWIRMDFAWERIETQKGVYSFEITDKLIDGAQKRGLKVLAILDYGNRLYEPRRSVITESGRAAFAAYAVALAKRYADKDVIWEIWNEPNNGGFWPGNKPGEYIDLVSATSKAVRKAVPNAILAGPSVFRMDREYLKKCFDLGLLDYVDAICFHPYRRERPEDLIEDMAFLRELIKKHLKPGQTTPAVICSEWGFSSTHHGLDGQACRLPRALLLSMLEGMSIYIYYDIWNDGDSPSNSEHNYGLFSSPPFLVPKPAACTYMAALKVLNGFRFEKRIIVPGSDTKKHFLLEFVNDNKEKRYVHWLADSAGQKYDWKLSQSIGNVTLVNAFGQTLSGIIRTGDTLTSTPFVEYMLSAPAVKPSYKILGRYIGCKNTDVPWTSDIKNSDAPVINGNCFETKHRDLAGVVDLWIKPTKADFGRDIVIGGDVKKPFLTLKIGIDKAGHIYAKHWVWVGRKWLNPMTSSLVFEAGSWHRITYEFGKEGRRLYVDGLPTASDPLETRGMAFSFQIKILNNNIGMLQVVNGKGFRL